MPLIKGNSNYSISLFDFSSIFFSVGGNEIFDEPDPLPSEDESEHEDDSKYIAISVADGNIKKEQLSDG